MTQPPPPYAQTVYLQDLILKQVPYAVVPLGRIIPDPGNSRTVFEEEELRELAEGYRVAGLPDITVRPSSPTAGQQLRVDEPAFEIIAGERRWRAALLGGHTEIGCRIRYGLTDVQVKALQLVENVQRKDLNLSDTCLGVRNLLAAIDAELIEAGDKTSSSLAIAAERLGKSKPWVSKRAAVYNLREDVQELMTEGLVHDVEILHCLERLAELDPEEFDSCMECYGTGMEDGQPTRDYLRQKLAELEKQAEAAAAHESKPTLPTSGDLELTAPEVDVSGMPLTLALRELWNEKVITDVEVLSLMMRLNELDDTQYLCAARDIRRQQVEELEEPVTVEWLRDIVKQLEREQIEKVGQAQRPRADGQSREEINDRARDASAAARAAAPDLSAQRRALAERLKPAVKAFEQDQTARIAQRFCTHFDPGQLFNSEAFITSNVFVREDAPHLPATAESNEYTLTLKGHLDKLGSVIDAFLPGEEEQFHFEGALTRAELRKIQRVLGRTLKVERKATFTGATIKMVLDRAERSSHAKRGAVSKGNPQEGAAGVGAFLKSCVKRKKDTRVLFGELHNAYAAYCERHNLPVMDIRDPRWDQAIGHAKIDKQKSNGKRYYLGVEILVGGDE